MSWRIRLVVLAACALLSVWLVKERHFLRMVPLPLAAISLLYDGPLSVPPPMAAKGGYLPTGADITTAAGLRQALDDIQAASPMVPMGPRPDLADFDAWVRLVTSSSMQCTDGTLLFQLAAWAQGVPVREWWLLPAGWPDGGGHSVVEFRHPRDGRWHLVDPQHGARITDPAGNPLSMADVLLRWRDGRRQEVAVDYGPHRQIMLARGRGPTVEDYFFDMRLLDQPVINLNPLGVVAAPLRRSFALAWVVYGPESRHDVKVVLTKVAAVLALGLLAWGLRPRRRMGRGHKEGAS